MIWHCDYWGWRRRYQTHTEAACIVVNYIFLCLWSSATLRMVLAGELGELLFQEGLSGFIICLLGLQVA